MRILFSSTGMVFNDGCAITLDSEAAWCWELCRYLVKRGHLITVLAPRVMLSSFISKSFSGKLKIIEVGGLERRPELGTDVTNWLRFSVESFILVRKLLKTKRFDVIHHVAPAWINYSFSFVPFVKARLPFVYGPIPPPWTERSRLLDNIFIKYLMWRIYYQVSGYLFKKTLDYSNKILVTFDFVKKLLPRDYCNVEVVPRAVNTHYFRPTWNEDEYILFMARLERKKGLEFLIKAMPVVVREFPNIRLYVCGVGSATRDFMKLVRRLGLQKSVKFLGLVSGETKLRLLQNCTVYCLPSIGDPSPKSILEAMDCGKPIVSTWSGGVPEFLEYGKAGVLVPPRDENALANALIALLSDRGLRLRLGRYARDRVEKEYSWSVVLSKLERIYHEVIEANGNTLSSAY